MIKTLLCIGAVSVALVGCGSNVRINKEEIQKHPVKKVCIQDNRNSPMTGYLKEVVDSLGFETEVYKTEGKMYNSEDCSHLLSYVFKSDAKNGGDGSKLTKTTYFFYNYYGHNERKRVGTFIDDRQRNKNYIDLNNKEQVISDLTKQLSPIILAK